MALVDVVEKSTAGVDTGITTWTMDGSHSSVGFSVKHMMIARVRGEFREVAGTLQWDPTNLENSSVQVTIQAASVETREATRDGHLRSADFFDVENHPEIAFRSTEFEQKNSGELLVKGDLTIRGVTKEVVLEAEGPSAELKDPWGGSRIAFHAETKVPRKDYGLLWNVALETGGILVGEDVAITIDAEFVKQ